MRQDSRAGEGAAAPVDPPLLTFEEVRVRLALPDLRSVYRFAQLGQLAYIDLRTNRDQGMPVRWSSKIRVHPDELNAFIARRIVRENATVEDQAGARPRAIGNTTRRIAPKSVLELPGARRYAGG